MAEQAPEVGIIMGSQSDWPTMRHAADVLDRLGIAYEVRIVSAHRTPKRLYDYATGARERGLKVIVAGAGGAAHLPGMAAAMTPLPVFGVPIESKTLKGQDSLLSIVQRSEEHTSELQSLMRISYAVFCLQKKKKPNNKA